ncbi:hypothetical protein [Cuniculiplasma divulgatum]|uniref:Uncharacterized protein n=1 Tax=Cuniculiplasma divulgatum TaxID=1673428 RepID=A0A1R4A731_9ARCH|nr:hypothetical protein [Cuniculiplasma divulgatum]SJK84752.1 hypothetical protein CPM_0910 [Cuniculiplasma divulgatum]
MRATTSFKVDENNIGIVQDLTRTRELSKILNYLLQRYQQDKGYISAETQIANLEAQVKAKDEQYQALKQEIAKE